MFNLWLHKFLKLTLAIFIFSSRLLHIIYVYYILTIRICSITNLTLLSANLCFHFIIINLVFVSKFLMIVGTQNTNFLLAHHLGNLSTGRTIFKCILNKQYVTAWNGFDLGQEPLAQTNDSSSSTKGEEFLDHAINYQIPRKESAKWSSLITLS
jgi:hypothetical protein